MNLKIYVFVQKECFSFLFFSALISDKLLIYPVLKQYQLVSENPAVLNIHGFQLCFLIHANNWNILNKFDKKLEKSAVHKYPV